MCGVLANCLPHGIIFSEGFLLIIGVSDNVLPLAAAATTMSSMLMFAEVLDAAIEVRR
jgi:hypothetical protein